MDAIAEVSVDRDPAEDVAELKYRADIDGLRAVAVLSVIAYHMGFYWIPGGYVGVDIFFVISGYLISTIVQREISRNTFSLAGFYSRRICRIGPAFAAMALVTSAFAYHYLFPSELEAFARSLIAASLSVSNIYLWSTTGYFEAAASSQPLLHTWSLAVEEQFYLFLPLCLMLIHRSFSAFRRRIIVVVACLSLGLSCYLVFVHPSATFYLIPTRAWELLVGTILSFSSLNFPISPGRREALSLVGMGLILVAFFGFSATTPFPGATALVPCVGTALIIAAGQTGRTFVGSILSTSPAVFIGRISYSLYLWHWPILVFQHQYALIVPNQGFTLGTHPFLFRNLVIAVVTLAIATISWRFIEEPYRFSYRTQAKPRVLIYGATTAVLLTGLGGSFLLSHGFSNRFSPRAVELASYLSYGQQHFRAGQCFILQPELATAFDKSTCLAERPGRKSYLLIGDSTAAELWYGLSTASSGSDILQATGAGCKPFVDQPLGANRECAKVIALALNSFLPTHPVYEVIMSGMWAPSDLPRIARSVAMLRQRGVRVVVLGPPIKYTSALPFLLALSVERNDPRLPDRELIQQSVLDTEVGQVAAAGGASYISMYGLLCHQQTCLKILPDGVPLQFDDTHFTREGSFTVAQRLIQTRALD